MFDLRNPQDIDKINKERLAKLQVEYDDAKKLFAKVFNNEEGERVIEMLEKHARVGFPDYNNPNLTYAQIGKQKLVDKINQLRKVVD